MSTFYNDLKYGIRMLVKQPGFSMTIVAILGLGIGVSGALMTAKFLSSQVYQISATDPVTFAAVPMILLLTAVLACYLPARRAAKTDPMEALRYE